MSEKAGTGNSEDPSNNLLKILEMKSIYLSKKWNGISVDLRNFETKKAKDKNENKKEPKTEMPNTHKKPEIKKPTTEKPKTQETNK